MKPPVPGVDASRKVSGETTCALPAVLITWLSVTFRSRSRSGSTCTCNCWSRIPQTEMLATPGTPIRRGRTVHRAITDCSMGVSSVDDSPIIRTRLEEDSGWSRVGGLETLRQGMGLGEPLLDQLPGLIDVRAGLEDQDDRGQAGHRLRPDHLDALHPVEQVGLEGDRDQLLDLFGRQPEGLGLDLGVGGRELRKHIHRSPPELHDAHRKDA